MVNIYKFHLYPSLLCRRDLNPFNNLVISKWCKVDRFHRCIKYDCSLIGFWDTSFQNFARNKTLLHNSTYDVTLPLSATWCTSPVILTYGSCRGCAVKVAVVLSFCSVAVTELIKNNSTNKNKSEWVSRIQHPTGHITGHFSDETFHEICCTDTDNQKQGNKTTDAPQTQKTNRKTALANKQTKLWFGMPFTAFPMSCPK